MRIWSRYLQAKVVPVSPDGPTEDDGIPIFGRVPGILPFIWQGHLREMHCSLNNDTISANDQKKGACLDNGPGLASEDELLQVFVAMCVFRFSQESLK